MSNWSKHFSVVRVLSVLLCSLLLFALFSFDYFDRTTEEAGIGFSLVPRLGPQKFDSELWGVLWVPGYDEWGGEPAFIREQLVGVWFNVVAMLLAQEVLVRFWPRRALAIRGVVLALAACVCSAAVFVQYSYDYTRMVFALRLCWPSDFDWFTFGGQGGLERGTWLTSERGVTLAKLADEFAPESLLVGFGSIVFAALSAARTLKLRRASARGAGAHGE